MSTQINSNYNSHVNFGYTPYKKRSAVKEYATAGLTGVIAGAGIATLFDVLPNRASYSLSEGLATIGKQAALWGASMLVLHAVFNLVRKLLD